MYMKKIGHFLKTVLFWFVQKGCTWEKGDGKFHVWTYLTIHFILVLIFTRACPKEDPPVEIRQITRISIYIYIYIYYIHIIKL